MWVFKYLRHFNFPLCGLNDLTSTPFHAQGLSRLTRVCLCTFYGFPYGPHVLVCVFACKGPAICLFTTMYMWLHVLYQWAIMGIRSNGKLFFHAYRFQEKSSRFITISALRVSQFYSANTHFTTFPCSAPTPRLPASLVLHLKKSIHRNVRETVNEGPWCIYGIPKSLERNPQWKRNFQKKKCYYIHGQIQWGPCVLIWCPLKVPLFRAFLCKSWSFWMETT